MKTQFEKLSDLKKCVKAAYRVAIRSKLFLDDGVLTVEVHKTSTKEFGSNVSIKLIGEKFDVVVSGDISTRIYNKINNEFFQDIERVAAKFKTYKGQNIILK